MMQALLNGFHASLIEGAYPIDWHELQQLLRTGAYDQAAEFLHKVQLAGEAAGNRAAADAAATVRQLCLACDQCQAEVEWHERASQTAKQREYHLRNYAEAMLDQVSEQMPLAASPATIPPFNGHDGNGQRTAGVGIVFDLQQGFQNLLAWGKRTFLLNPPSIALAVPAPLSVAPLPMPLSSGYETTEATPTLPEPTIKLAIEPSPRQTAETPALATVQASCPPQSGATALPAKPLPSAGKASPTLAVYCLGPFRVYQDDQLIEEWPSGKGQAIFKYLLLQRTRPTPKEVLMDLFWPDAAPDAARNNLNVAIYGLRRALRSGRTDFSHVMFQNDCYLLNPALSIWLDVEEFAQHLATGQRLEQTGEQAKAIHEYRAAEALYLGEFLAEDRYEDWPLARRQQHQDEYIGLLDRLSVYYLEQTEYELCAMLCNKLLTIDACQEEAQRRLMRCYSRQGHLNLALRQYHLCVEALTRELDVAPSRETEELHAKIRHRKPV